MFKRIAASLITTSIFFANPVHAEKMSATQKLWEINQPAYHAILRTPFIQQMLNNTLTEESMQAFMLQDRQYLLDYEKAVHLIALKFPPHHPMRMFFLRYEKGTRLEREFLETTFLSEVKSLSPQKTPVTAAYTKHLLTTAQHGNVPEAVAAILPCPVYFNQLGKYLRTHVKNLDEHRYAAWIKRYSDSDDGSTATVQAIADYLLEEHPDTFEKMKENFSKSAGYELEFFQYNASKLSVAEAVRYTAKLV